MMLLHDENINDLLQGDKPLIGDMPSIKPEDVFKADSPVQAASVDLHVGKIYVPETDANQFGGVDKPKECHVLEAGHTVVVQSKEEVDLPPDLAGIGFPPAHLSARGLLTTNPGHVDPGYKGRLSLTIINMGRVAHEIRPGDVIVTLLLFQMKSPARAPYNIRFPNSQAKQYDFNDRMSYLSRDFLQVDDRAKKVARDEETKTRRWSIAVPAIIAAVALAGTFGNAFLQERSGLANSVRNQEKEIAVLRQQIADLKVKQQVANPQIWPHGLMTITVEKRTNR